MEIYLVRRDLKINLFREGRPMEIAYIGGCSFYGTTQSTSNSGGVLSHGFQFLWSILLCRIALLNGSQLLAKEQWTIVYNTIPHSRKQEEEKYQQQMELVQFQSMVTLASMEPIHRLIQAGHLGILITKCSPYITTRSTLYPTPSSP